MFCKNGAQLAAKSVSSESVVAREFFQVLWRLSNGEHCRGLKTNVKKNIHTPISQKPIRRRPFQAQFSTLPQRPDEESKLSEKPPIPNTLRHLMRSLPSSVVVLTTSATVPKVTGAAKQTPEHYYRGMTLSSFTTLSLSPPLVTFNIRAPSRTLSAIKQSRRFLIHVLEGNRAGATVADSFTKGNADGIEVREAFRAREGSFQVENFNFELKNRDSDALSGMEIGLPRLAGNGVKRVLACELYEFPPTTGADLSEGLIEVGEHVMVVAKVISILPDEDPEQNGDDVQYGLSYVDGRYRTVGKTLMAHDTKNDSGEGTDGVVL